MFFVFVAAGFSLREKNQSSSFVAAGFSLRRRLQHTHPKGCGYKTSVSSTILQPQALACAKRTNFHLL
jgi:hypothetical protein